MERINKREMPYSQRDEMTRRLDVLLVAGFAVAIALAGWLASSLSGTPLVGYDDANIFFVYARNLVDGLGFVYYPGGERVEGFTSVLWLLICGAATALTARFELLLFTINVALATAAAWALHAYLIDVLVRLAHVEPRRAHLMSIALMAAFTLTPGFVVWNVVSLMDSGLWSAVLLVCVLGVLRSAPGAPTPNWVRAWPVLLGILVLTRPEALLWGPALVAVAIFLRVAGGATWTRAVIGHTAAILAFAGTTAGTFALRIAYFGYALPNTYYAKAGDPLAARLSAGAIYLLDFAVTNPAIPSAIAAAIGTAIVLAGRYRANAEVATRQLLASQLGVLVLLVTGCIIPVLEGGDHFGFWRMYQPVVPLAAIQVVLTLAAIGLRAQKAQTNDARGALVLALALAMALVPWRHWPSLAGLDYSSPFAPGGGWSTPKVEISIAQDMREIGRAFNRAFPSQQPSVGVIVAGGFALEYRGATIDLMGLNNVAMAHSPGPRFGMRNHAAFDPDVFFAQAPDIVLLSLWSPQRPGWFGFPMLSGEFDALPHLQPEYFTRRAASMAAFDAGALKGMLRQNRMGAGYAWASVRPNAGEAWIHAVFSRPYLERLRGLGYEVVLPGAPE
jgi:hypothetical protein